MARPALLFRTGVWAFVLLTTGSTRAFSAGSTVADVRLPTSLHPLPAVVAFANEHEIPIDQIDSPDPSVPGRAGGSVTALIMLSFLGIQPGLQRELAACADVSEEASSEGWARLFFRALSRGGCRGGEIMG